MPGRNRQPTEWQNRRVAKAMGAPVTFARPLTEGEPLPPLPDPITPDAMCEWIAQVAPNIELNSEADSNYRKRLISIASRHQFRKKKMQERDE